MRSLNYVIYIYNYNDNYIYILISKKVLQAREREEKDLPSFWVMQRSQNDFLVVRGGE